MISNLNPFIKIIKNYYNKKNSNISKNHNYFLNTFDETLGFIKLLELQKKQISFMDKYFILLKNLFATSKVSDLVLINEENIKNYDTIILTHGNYSHFSKKGDYFDPSFNENSKQFKKILWFVISTDHKMPINIGDNIVLLINKNANLLNFNKFIKLVFKKMLIFFFKKKSPQFLHTEQFSDIVWKNINKLKKIQNIKKIFSPYEAQPHQNFLNYRLNLKNNKIKTIGYVHSTQAFPIHLFKRDGAPKKLFVHGKDQKYHLIKFLGWKKSDIQLIPSLKIRNKNKKNYQNLIYLPYIIEDFNFYLDNIRFLLTTHKNKFSHALKVKLHPYRKNKKTHLKLKKEIELFIAKNKFNKKLSFCNPIVLGTSSVVLEILENNLKPYHIYKNFILESYLNGFWPSIRGVPILTNKIFQYKLNKNNNCINIDGKKRTIFK
jgi:hypothetical protein